LENAGNIISIDDLTKRAETGDADAQGQLAYRYLSGEGVEPNLKIALRWLELAAHGGNPWAQTEFALKLRSTKDPENEVASVYWLNKACEQSYTLARTTLGAQQFEGIGTDINHEAAMSNFILASLDGDPDARKFVNLLFGNPKINWDTVLDKVQWALMMFYMGPLVDGHLDGLTENRLQNPYDSNAPWMDYEREVADSLFLFKNGPSPLFSSFFDADVSFSKIHTGISQIAGEPLAVTTVSLRDIKLGNGLPVYWPPNYAQIKPILPALSMSASRKFIHFNYARF